MKIIIDFDDTIFSSKDFKGLMFSGLERFGVNSERVSTYYKEHRGAFTNPRNFYLSFVLDNNLDISAKDIDEAVDGLFVDLKRFVNEELIGIFKKVGPENCFIVSIGEEDFQRRKIKSCEIEELFGEIHIVGKDKNETIEKLMNKFKGEEFVFVDDNLENIEKARKIVNKEQELHVVHYPGEMEIFKGLVNRPSSK